MRTPWLHALLLAAPLATGTTALAFAGGAPTPDQATTGTAAARPGTPQATGPATRPATAPTTGDATAMTAAIASRRAEHHQAMLAKYDANHDGKLDDAERAALRDDKLARRFAALDTDHDGKLTLAEFKAGAGTGLHRHGRHGHQRRHGTSKPR